MKPFPRPVFVLMLLSGLLAGCSSGPALSPTATASLPPASPTLLPPTETPVPTGTFTPTATPEPLKVRFAVIGDYGLDGTAEADVAALVHGWQPDIILTVGDDNYPSGAAGTIDANIGKYYHDYIQPYTGTYGPGADVNRFFPSLGNHDWYTQGAQPYLTTSACPAMSAITTSPGARRTSLPWTATNTNRTASTRPRSRPPGWNKT